MVVIIYVLALTVEQIIIKTREADVVLLFGAKDEEHNNAVALKEYIVCRSALIPSLEK